MNGEVYLTAQGERDLREELNNLITVERKSLAARLRDAIHMGDLSENADYKKAKEDQGFLEGRIQEIEYILKNAITINEASIRRDVVSLGSRVTIQEGQDEPEVYQMVGVTEADPRNRRISNESPIGKALLDHKVGDLVRVETPAGETRFKIIKIE